MISALQLSDPRRLLSCSAVYSWFRRCAAGDGSERFVRDHLRPRADDRMLDIGCGPGDILEYLPPMDYVGFDISAAYIAKAQKRWGRSTRGRALFHQWRVSDDAASSLGCFDLVLALGVLHHLDDEKAVRLFELAHSVLAPRGRLVTIDPCFAPGQSWCSKRLVSLDRGRYVRRPEQYFGLAERFFPAPRSTLRHDLNRFPFTHFILECDLRGV